ncbi:MAG: VWA domain-containing protein [Ardenticatenales bacterium]
MPLVFLCAIGPAPAQAEDVSPCRAAATRDVAPNPVRVGDAVTVTATLVIACPDVPAPADIVLVIDRSASMFGAPLASAKHAAGVFVDTVDLARTRVAIVAFDDVATIEVPLSSWRNRLRGAIAGIEVPLAAGTDIVRALSAAGRALGAGSDSVGGDQARGVRAIVLLSDGVNNRGAEPVLQQAAVQRANGIHLSTIALGRRADRALMRAIAASPADAWTAPSGGDLAAIYTRIADRLQHLDVRSIAVDDIAGDTLIPIVGSAVPQSIVTGDHQRWTIPAAGTVITITYRLTTTRPGRWPISASTDASYEDALGRAGIVHVPVPSLDVLAEWPTSTATARPPVPTPMPSRAPSATPTHPAPGATTPSATPAAGSPTVGPSATMSPTRIYLPFAAAAGCLPGADRLDVSVILDVSTTMAGPTASGRPKIEAAVEGIDRLIAGLEARGHARVGLVRFNAAATEWAPLSEDLAAVRRAVHEPIGLAHGSRIDLGLRAAVLQFDAAAGARHRAAVLVSDGQAFGATEDQVLAAADAVRATGAEVFAVAVGPRAAQGLLLRVAGTAERVFDAGDGDGFVRAFKALGGALPCP